MWDFLYHLFFVVEGLLKILALYVAIVVVVALYRSNQSKRRT